MPEGERKNRVKVITAENFPKLMISPWIWW